MDDTKLTNEKPMSFKDVVLYCAGQSEFLKEFNRLTSCQLGKPRSPLEQMIDEATGYEQNSEESMLKFIAFVYETVRCTLPEEAFRE